MDGPTVNAFKFVQHFFFHLNRSDSRKKNLKEAFDRMVRFHEDMINALTWLTSAESKVAELDSAVEATSTEEQQDMEALRKELKVSFISSVEFITEFTLEKDVRLATFIKVRGKQQQKAMRVTTLRGRVTLLEHRKHNRVSLLLPPGNVVKKFFSTEMDKENLWWCFTKKSFFFNIIIPSWFFSLLRMTSMDIKKCSLP